MVARFEPSPGAVNSVVIHEINYHAPDSNDPGDWVELHNAYTVPVDLSGWVLRDSAVNHAFTIPDGMVLGPGDFLLLCANLESFSIRFPHVRNAIGDLGFNLGNGGDQVRLFNSRKQLVDQVSTGLSLLLWTEPARTYQIQTATDRFEWHDWRLVIGNGETMSCYVDLSETAQARFFRVKLVLPSTTSNGLRMGHSALSISERARCTCIKVW
jgi:hypothetical protein